MGSLPHPLEAFFRDPGLLTQDAPYRLDPYVLTLGLALLWYLAESTGPAAGAAEGRKPYLVLDDLAAQIHAGCDGVTVIPAFGGPRSESAAERAILGLKLNHGSAHVYRAILESFGYLLRAEDIPPERVICTGGSAASAMWRQIVSDITGYPLAYHPQVDPCLGSAFLVAYALHIVETFDANHGWLPAAEITSPSEEFRDRYEDGYRRFTAAEKLTSRRVRSASCGTPGAPH